MVRKMSYNKRIAMLIKQECENGYYTFTPKLTLRNGSVISVHLNDFYGILVYISRKHKITLNEVDNKLSKIIFDRMISDLHTKYGIK